MTDVLTPPMTELEAMAITAGPVPIPTSYNDILPDLTPPNPYKSELMGNDEVYLFGFKAGDDHHQQLQYLAPISHLGTITPAWPSKVYFKYKTYWQLVGQHQLNGTSGHISKTVEYGTSETNQYNLSVTLGAKGNNLSADLTTAFSHSITINNSTTFSDTWDSGPLKPGMTCGILAVYQLCSQFVWINGDTGEEMAYSGYTASTDPGIPAFLKQPLLNIANPHFNATFTQFATTD